MKKMNTYTALLGIGAALMVAQPNAFAQQSRASEIPGAVGDHIPLGTAYDSISGKFLNFQPVRGQAEERTGGQSKVISKTDLSFREVASLLSGEVNVDLDFPVVQANAGAQLALATGSDEYSLNWVLSVINEGGSRALVPMGTDSGLTLSEQGQAIVDQNLPVRDRLAAVGNEFVQEIVYASYLLVSMKIDFVTKDEKIDVGGQLEVDFAAGSVQGDVSFLSEEQKRSTTITVRAHQFGGDPLGLLGILPSNVVQCTFENLDPCLQVFSSAVQYAQGTGAWDGNPSAFINQGAELSNANVVRYITESYDANLGTNALATTDAAINPNLRSTVTQLEREYVTELENHQRASLLLTNSLRYLTGDQRRSIRTISRAARENAGALKDLMDYCNRNVYDTECQDYISANCPTSGSSRSCFNQYSATTLDVDRKSQLELTQAQYDNLHTGGSQASFGTDLLGLNTVEVFGKDSTQPWSYDPNSGRVSGVSGIVLASRDETYTGSFLVKSDTKVGTAALWPQGDFSSFSISVYKDNGWAIAQNSSFEVDQSAIDGAQQVDGHYYYYFDLVNVTYPVFDINILWTTDTLNFYFYKPDAAARSLNVPTKLSSILWGDKSDSVAHTLSGINGSLVAGSSADTSNGKSPGLFGVFDRMITMLVDDYARFAGIYQNRPPSLATVDFSSRNLDGAAPALVCQPS